MALTKSAQGPAMTGARTAGSAVSGGLLRHLDAAGNAVAGMVIVLAALLAGTGWLYVLRGLHWFTIGPRLSDSLPLLQLAGFDGQPLVRVVIAWLLAGVLAGVALIRVPRLRRSLFAGVLCLLVLLLAAQVSYALARNLRLSAVLFDRSPGLGPVVEGLMFTLGCCLPRPIARRQRARARRRSFVSVVTGFDDRGLGGGQNRDAAQDDGDREQVAENHSGASA
jgi:hypothetical protein